MFEPFPYSLGVGPYESRAYGLGNLGNLAPLLGMGSTLAGYMGHSNLANMLGAANGLMGKFSSLFPNTGSSGNLFGSPFYSGAPPGIGSTGFPFPGMPSFGLPYASQSPGWTGFGAPAPGSQGSGFGNFMQSLFGAPGSYPGYGGGMPGFF